MKRLTRDLLLIRKDVTTNAIAIEKEVSMLHVLLQSVETVDSLSKAFELIDLKHRGALQDLVGLGQDDQR